MLSSYGIIHRKIKGNNLAILSKRHSGDVRPQAKLNLSYTIISAPSTGIIGKKTS